MNCSLVGIGVGVLIGSFIKTTNYTGKKSRDSKVKITNIGRYRKTNNKRFSINKNLNHNFNLSNYKKEIIELSSKWEELSNKNNDLDLSAFIIFLDDYKYSKLSPSNVLPAASTIKIPILLLTLQMLDNGELLWNEAIKIEQNLKGGGAGWMAYEPIGSLFPIHEIATEMIRVSDNTAANLLIKRLGGIQAINNKLENLGLENTKLNNLLPDLEGTNVTSSRDLVLAISLIESGEILTQKSRDLFREIMSTSKSNNLIPKGILRGIGDNSQERLDSKLLIKGYRVYNKTGDIGITYGDTGIIQLPDSKRAIAAFLVKGPFNDSRSPELIREMTKAIIQVLNPKTLLPL